MESTIIASYHWNEEEKGKEKLQKDVHKKRWGYMQILSF